jgi:outer membrane receptor for ferrienterochelin and colicins
MNKTTALIILALLIFITSASAQTDNNSTIKGQVVTFNGTPLSSVTIQIKNKPIKATTGKNGRYQLPNLPEGILVVEAMHPEYRTQTIATKLNIGETREINFQLKPYNPDEEEEIIAISTDKVFSPYKDSIRPGPTHSASSTYLHHAMIFSPGLRMETTCQNCGFSHIRINGLKNSHSQLLINNQPLMNNLLGGYGNKMLPSDMVNKIEIIRGWSPASYASAIAGNINLELKEPDNNSYELGINNNIIGVGTSGIGGLANGFSLNMNTSIVSPEKKTGMVLYGFFRDNEPFDANNDEFSELPGIRNTSIGAKVFHHIDSNKKLTVDFFKLNDTRSGGNYYRNLPHTTDITEKVSHNVTTGLLSYEHSINQQNLFTLYLSGQKANRDSYFGAQQSLEGYGNTEDISYNIGSQYKSTFKHASLTIGVEYKGGMLKNKELGYQDINNAGINENNQTIYIPYTGNKTIDDQNSNIFASFSQYELYLSNLTISAGARYDHFEIKNTVRKGQKTEGDIISPRVALKYKMASFLQSLVSYSHGYRAPQIFEDNLHVATSGLRQVYYQNSQELTKETSHNFLAKMNFENQYNNTLINFSIEGFYTQLTDAFAINFGVPDNEGVVINTWFNTLKGAEVKGGHIGLEIMHADNLSLKSAFTIQTSEYKGPQAFNQRSFLRTPDKHGYLIIGWEPIKNLTISSTTNYTGKMLVPYFGNQGNVAQTGQLRKTDRFFDVGMRVLYNLQIGESSLQVYTGMRNIFNAYQDDFDRGINRDPAYVYGPMDPKSLYFGIRMGNLLK